MNTVSLRGLTDDEIGTLIQMYQAYKDHLTLGEFITLYRQLKTVAERNR